jgi:hypothetical protein
MKKLSILLLVVLMFGCRESENQKQLLKISFYENCRAQIEASINKGTMTDEQIGKTSTCAFEKITSKYGSLKDDKSTNEELVAILKECALQNK